MALFVPSCQLANGVSMPVLALGTYRLKGESAQRVLTEAIEIGYRSIDTASVYKNEADLGFALRELLSKAKITREELFITTKIAPRDQGEEKAYKAVLDSLSRLGPDIRYLDLVLIHWPGTQGLHVESPKNIENRLGTWRALERHLREQRVRAIGVSNFTIAHLESLCKVARVIPHVNQFEMHPLLDQRDLVQYCLSNGIKVQAYSPLGEGRFVNGDVEIAELGRIAERYGVSKAQVLIRWGTAKGAAVVVKASSRERLMENFASFSIRLNEKDVGLLESAGAGMGEMRFCWDPTKVA
ncbi:aldo-keto reductase [Cladochytrium replicatum]|nr:aldo-keto reductase [Cladochytrium replicatum]